MQALPPMVDVAFVHAGPDDAPWVAEVLDPGELARWQAMRPAARPLFLAAHVGVRMVAAFRLIWAGPEPAPAPALSSFGWNPGPTGKPHLTYRDGSPLPLHVSVAHAAKTALVAAAGHGPIGVDVEHVEPRRPLVALARRFFSPAEAAAVESAATDSRVALFHQLWTRKEAVLKATGAGLRGGLSVPVDGPADRDGWRRVELPGRDAPMFVCDLRSPDAALVAALAIEGQPGAVRQMTLMEWTDGRTD